ncbi:guanine nucleotide exchange protein SMCR8-like [Littorina saxatilis]|uniref:guanine nucleotide exchange protein SMCR8-like n=1 Tax=Littorina saxatilis TaxID=31220 RepID=UPI0038B5783B
MFGEYAQIATYLPSTRDPSGAGDYSVSGLPPHLLPPPPIAQTQWAGGGPGRRGRGHEFLDSINSMDDFVMVAEFSEIEGPKPVLTIPKDAGSNIDQNALSVKLMAVDHQTSSEGFSISEDTQVVLSDDESGVSAFVHHFVLYDNQARGFVRPYCMVFISSDIRKIIMFYEELSSQFKRAARFLKYGNRLLFVKDLERHLQDLEHTKGYLLNQVSRMRLRDTDGDGPESDQSKSRNSAENELYKGLQNIRQSTTEIRDILSILKPLLHDQRLESRFRALEERAFHRGNEDAARAEKLSLQEDWFADNVYSESTTNVALSGSLKESSISPVSLFKKAPSHTPLLVETKKAKRFNSPLRGLHELCSWGAKEGLRKLRCIHEYFKKDAMVLEIEKNESRLMDPASSMILHGQCVTSNVLAGVSMRGSSLCLSEDSTSILLSADRLRRWPSIASDDTLESFKSVDSYLSIQDDENASLYSFASNNSSQGVTTSASGQDFMSAPTSPMTEEVAFPPQTKPPSNATPVVSSPSAPVAMPGHITNQDLQNQNAEFSPSSSVDPPKALNCSASASQSYSSSSPHVVKVTHSTSKPNNGGMTETASHNTNTSFGSAETSTTQKLSSLSERLQDQNSDSRLQICGDKEDQKVLQEASDAETKDNSAGSPDSGASKIAEIFHQAVLDDRQGGELSRSNSETCSNVSNGGAGVADKSGGRAPSFVPLAVMTPAQQIRAAQAKKRSGSNSLSSSPEKMVDSSPRSLDRLRLELTGSFKSIASSSPAQTDDSWCDIEAFTDSTCNPFPAYTPSPDSCTWKPRHGVYTAGDVINSIGPGRPGYGIHEVLTTYTNLHSVVFSLMTGRTVLVVGSAKMELEVTKIVTALTIFLPDTKRKQHSVVEWMNRPLKVTDLTRIRLAGICRSEKRSLDATIPTAVKQYSTLMDVERRMILGPQYQGTMLNSVLQQKKSFRTDAQHVALIHSWLMEIGNKAFIFYHSFCLGEAGGLTQSHSIEKHREQYNTTICSLMNRLGVRDHDITIVEYLAEKVKQSQLEPHVWTGVDKGSIVHPLTVSSRGSHTFRC